MSFETPARNKTYINSIDTNKSNSNFLKYFCPSVETSKSSLFNNNLIQLSKESNLIGKIISNDLTFNIQKTLDCVHKSPYSIKRSVPSSLQYLLESAQKEKKHKSSSTIKNLMLTDFHKGTGTAIKSALLCSSPANCIIPNFNAKMSISTKDEDSIPKIKSLILTPKAPINDFSNAYNKNIKKTNFGASGNENIVFPSYLMNTPPNVNNTKMTKMVMSSKVRDEEKGKKSLLDEKKIFSSIEKYDDRILSKKHKRDDMPSPIKSNNKTWINKNNNSSTSIMQQSLQCSASSFKPRKIKKTSKCFIDFEKASYLPSNDLRYNYLNVPFSDSLDLTSEYYHEPSFIAYQLYITFGKSNEENLRFGENPLCYYQNLLENLKNKELSEQSKAQLCQKLQSIHKELLNLPVFILPQELHNDIHKNQLKESKNTRLFSNSLEAKYRCLICHVAFTTAQGLGGHMSRKHKDQSNNYKKKKAIREKRAPVRKLNDFAKKTLCEKYGHDYDDWNKCKVMKKEMKRFIDKHRKEFLTLRKELKEIKGC